MPTQRSNLGVLWFRVEDGFWNCYFCDNCGDEYRLGSIRMDIVTGNLAEQDRFMLIFREYIEHSLREITGNGIKLIEEESVGCEWAVKGSGDA